VGGGVGVEVDAEQRRLRSFDVEFDHCIE
jgi:hypothetical protein